MNSNADNPTTPTVTAVLFISCCDVLSGASGSIFCACVCLVSVEDDFLDSAVAALCIGLEGWLLGGLIFDGPPAMSLSPAFFVPGFTSLFTPSFIPETACFSLLL